MLECAASGEILDLIGPGPCPGLVAMRKWGSDQTVRAAVLRHLLVEPVWPTAAKGVRLRGLCISGVLDTEAASLRCPLELDCCHLDDSAGLMLDNGTIPLLSVMRCHVAGLSARNVVVRTDLDLSGSCIRGALTLPGARIAGSLKCSRTHLGSDGDGNALSGTGIRVGGSVLLNEGFTAAGTVRLSQGHIAGNLSCRDARLGCNSEGNALTAHGLRVGGYVYLDGKFTCEGAIWLAGAHITGQLRCDGAHLGANDKGNALYGDVITVQGGVILGPWRDEIPFTADGAVWLKGANLTGSLVCTRARLAANKDGNALVGDDMKISVAAILDEGFSAAGAVRLSGSTISGQLRCTGARLDGRDEDEDSLVGDEITVGGSVFFDGGFDAKRAVRLSAADITGSLYCTGARIGTNSAGNALIADGIKVRSDVFLDDGFLTKGAVRLPRADITGQFRCNRGQIDGHDQDHDSLLCAGIRVGGSALLNGLITAGSVGMAGADITGRVRCEGAELGEDKNKNSFYGDAMKAGRDVSLTGLVTAGAVKLTGAAISGTLNCARARLGANKDNHSLVGDEMTVKGDVLLTEPRARDSGASLTTCGAVRMNGAQISGHLRCGGALLSGRDVDDDTLIGNRLKVGGSVFLTGGFSTAGAVRLAGADISGQLSCDGAQLGANKMGDSLFSDGMKVHRDVLFTGSFTAVGNVSLRRTQISATLQWTPDKPLRGGTVNLEGASAFQLTDQWTPGRPNGCWPINGLRLEGFSYYRFGGSNSQPDVTQRLSWIRSQDETASSRQRHDRVRRAMASAATFRRPIRRAKTEPQPRRPVAGFATEPYKQLAQVYRRAGQDDEARTVEIERRRDLRRYGRLSPGRMVSNWLLDHLIGYGFKTYRAAAALLILYAAVFLPLQVAQYTHTLARHSLIVPTDASAVAQGITTQRCSAKQYSYSCFYPVGYAFDIVVPLINLHQADNWRPNGWAMTAGVWAVTGAGWFLATLLVIGYSGLARRD